MARTKMAATKTTRQISSSPGLRDSQPSSDGCSEHSYASSDEGSQSSRSDEDEEEEDSTQSQENMSDASEEDTSKKDESSCGGKSQEVTQDLDNEVLNDHSFMISPEIKFGSDFNEDLHHALSGKVDFLGNYCHFELTPSAPNPCLHIEGLGSIGVPLSSREAMTLADHATCLPDLDSDISEGNIWSIDPSQVTFNNLDWSKFVHETVSKTIWGSLGIPPYFQPARCELHKLLIFGPGASTLPEQGENANGVLATILIQLPSSFTGGNIQVSHQSGTTEVNLSERPFVTSVIASYTGTRLHSSPITTGYRLALLYNLITTFPAAPRNLPKESLMALKLRYVLQKWDEGAYKGSPSSKRFAYILDQRKESSSRRRNGPGHWQDAKQKTGDEELVSCLRAVAEEFGYIVFPGQLTYRQQGEPDAGCQWWCKDDCRDHNVNDMSLTEADETEVIFVNMVEPDGTALDGARIKLDEQDFVPMDFFSNLPPDEKDYDPECRTLDYFFYRSAVLVLPKAEEEKIIEKANEKYWLSKLEQLDPAGSVHLDSKKIDFILSRMWGPDQSRRQRLLQIALRWKDLDTWWKTMQQAGNGKKIEEILDAWPVFSFKQLMPMLNDMMLEALFPEGKLNTLEKLESHATAQDQKIVTAWCTKQYTKILTIGSPPGGWNNVPPVPVILRVGRARGAAFLAQVLVPHLVKYPPLFSFIHELFNELLQNAPTIPNTIPLAASPADGDSQMTATKVAQLCLESTLKQPKYKIYQVSTLDKLTSHDQGSFTRLTDVIQLCIAAERLHECTVPLRLLLHTEPRSYRSLVNLYEPIIDKIRASLTEAKHSVTSPPFRHFFAALIGMHLGYLLNSSRPAKVDIPTFGCGSCNYCQRIDQYLRDSGQLQLNRHMYAAEKKHVEPFLRNSTLLQNLIQPAPGYNLNVVHLHLTKNPSLQKLQAWESKIIAAKFYLARIGTHAEIATLMGDEFEKIMEAMAGKRAYIGSQHQKDALGPITAQTLELPSATIRATQPPLVTTPNIRTTPALPSTDASASARPRKRKQASSEQGSGTSSKKARRT